MRWPAHIELCLSIVSCVLTSQTAQFSTGQSGPSQFHLSNTISTLEIHSLPHSFLFLTHDNNKQVVFKWGVPNWFQALDLALLTHPLADDQTTQI